MRHQRFAGILCSLLFLLIATPAMAATRTVTSTADSGAGSLREALAIASSGDTIVFSVGYYKTITLTGTLTVDKSLTIDGTGSPGLAISGNNAVGVFSVTGGNPTFVHLTIASGNSFSSGGAINADYPGTVTVDSCTLSNNNTTYYGGAIYSVGTLNVVNSTFSGNKAAFAGGAIYSNGSLTARNSTFVGNISTQDFGGGIFQYSGGTGTVTNTLFLGNTALQGWGGSIDAFGIMQGDHNLYWNNADLNGTQGTNCNGCTADTNAVTADPKLGSLVDNGGPTPTFMPGAGSAAIDAGDDNVCNADPVNYRDQRVAARPQGAHCDIGAVEKPHWLVTSTNDPASGTPSNCPGPACRLRDALAAAANGDLIHFAVGQDQTITLGSTLTVDTSLIIDGAGSPGLTISGDNQQHQVFSVNGGANATFAHLTIANGFGGSAGGGINADSSATVTVDACTLSNNSAEGGGAIFSAGTLKVVNSTFSGNLSAGGSAIYSDGTLDVVNSTFSGNTTIYSGGGAGIWTNGSLTVRNSTFVDNVATGAGGGIYQYSVTGTGTVTNTLFLRNTAQGQGGSIYISGSMQADHNLYWNNTDTNGAQGNNCNSCTDDTNAVTADPALGSFADNGGPTWTFLPGLGSAALDAGDDSVCSAAPVNAVDQRGIARPQGAHCDIGAVETTHPADTIFFDGFDAGVP